jgi:hypothetical protein
VRILATDNSGNMANESPLAVEDVPSITTVGLGGLELSLVIGLDVLVAKLGPLAADREVNTSVGGDLAVLGVLAYLGLIGAAGVAGGSGRREVGRAGGASDGDIEGRLLAGGVGVAKEAVDGLLAEGLEDGVLFKELDALDFKL